MVLTPFTAKIYESNEYIGDIEVVVIKDRGGSLQYHRCVALRCVCLHLQLSLILVYILCAMDKALSLGQVSVSTSSLAWNFHSQAKHCLVLFDAPLLFTITAKINLMHLLIHLVGKSTTWSIAPSQCCQIMQNGSSEHRDLASQTSSWASSDWLVDQHDDESHQRDAVGFEEFKYSSGSYCYPLIHSCKLKSSRTDVSNYTPYQSGFHLESWWGRGGSCSVTHQHTGL